MAPRYVAIANPDSKRWQTYHDELLAFWDTHGVTPEVAVAPWSVIVPRDGNLDGLTEFDAPAVVRLESPGRDFESAKLLLEAGSRETADAPRIDWRTLPCRKGQLRYPRLFYRGFHRVLTGLRHSFDRRPHLHPLACTLAIAELFDKNATAARLTAAGIPCPPSFAAPPTAAALLDELRRRRYRTAYVKLNTGSSAAAMVVVHPCAEPPWGVGTLVQLDDGFYSTRRLRHYTGSELNTVLEFLLGEDVCVQQGIPMAQIDGQNFDVRVVVVHGQPAATIFRLSSLPMTNLHLGGRRGDYATCRAAVPSRAWLDGLDHCVAAAQLVRAAMVGVDLLFEQGYLRHYVLEVNAFGDFFPGLVDEQGRSVHRLEIERTTQLLGLIGT